MAKRAPSPGHDAESAGAFPERLGDEHLHPGSGWLRNLAMAIVFVVPLGAALLGLLGGGDHTVWRGETGAARLSVESPPILRSGNWFETWIVAEPRVDVADLTIAIDTTLWNRLSIDTLLPDAESATYQDGAFRFSFGPVERGERYEVKLDGQIQPWVLRRLAGRVRLLDGERELASVPIATTVLP